MEVKCRPEVRNTRAGNKLPKWYISEGWGGAVGCWRNEDTL